MSKLRNVIELTPPDRIRNEEFVTEEFLCGYCNGRGFFASGLIYQGIIRCPDCGGTGRVRARVVIFWTPSKKTDG